MVLAQGTAAHASDEPEGGTLRYARARTNDGPKGSTHILLLLLRLALGLFGGVLGGLLGRLFRVLFCLLGALPDQLLKLLRRGEV